MRISSVPVCVGLFDVLYPVPLWCGSLLSDDTFRFWLPCSCIGFVFYRRLVGRLFSCPDQLTRSMAHLLLHFALRVHC